MYLGSETNIVSGWIRRFRPGFGGGDYYERAALTETLHVYRCACGDTVRILAQASEPFYCWQCGKLISIEPEAKP